MKAVQTNTSFFLNHKNQPLNQFKQKVFKQLQSLPFPNQKQEFWRKTKISDLEGLAFKPKDFSVQCKKLEDGTLKDISSEQIQIQKLDFDDKAFPIQEMENLYEKFKENYFVLLNLLFAKAHVIHISENQKTELVLEYSVTPEENALFSPLLFIKVGKFSEVQISEKMQSCSKQKLVNHLTFIQCDESSKVHYTAIRNFSEDDFHIDQCFVEQKRHSSFYNYSINFGGKNGKHHFLVDNDGEGSFTRLLGLSFLQKKEHNDIEMSIEHNKSHTQSSILYRALVDDNSHHIFTGNLKIPNSLKDIDSIQLNHNLLLNSKAKAESIPKLEVLSESVMCEHGATVGEIDKEMLFYLYSRGLKEKEAKKLLIEGFVAKILDEMPSQYFHSSIWDEIEKRINL